MSEVPQTPSPMDAETVAWEGKRPSGRDAPEFADLRSFEKPGDRIGKYHLQEVIGEGGFGIVYLAEQKTPVRRKVALKVIKPGMDTVEVIARFERERQALALMDHPGVASVFDAGVTEKGRPFFVMELVKGVEITRYCEDKGIDLSMRLRLFCEVCSAVQHAHQKGVIHRDLKPSNILVAEHDGKPYAKVIDFGIARSLENPEAGDTLLTRQGVFIGTPQYMSPEQAEGSDVDTRGDVFSLGAVLYELLSGSPPVSGAHIRRLAIDEMLRIIREEVPRPPSANLNEDLSKGKSTTITRKEIRGDLDRVILKALEKEPERRYQTAKALGADIGRFLAHEPVEAKGAGSAYRLKKFARRHRRSLALVGFVFLVLHGGIAVSAWQVYRARQQAKLAHEAAETSRQTLSFFEDHVLSSVRPLGSGGLGADVTIRDAVESSREKLAGTFSNQPDARAAIREAFAVIQPSSEYENSRDRPNEGAAQVAYLQAALEKRRETFGPGDTATIRTSIDLAKALTNVGEYREAITVGKEVLPYSRELGTNHSDLLKDSLDALASAYYHAGWSYLALPLAREVYEISRNDPEPDSVTQFYDLNFIGYCQSNSEIFKEAVETFTMAYRHANESFGSDHHHTLSSIKNLGRALCNAGRFDEGLEKLHEAVALGTRIYGANHPETLDLVREVADYLGRAGRKDEAVEAGVDLLARTRKFLGEMHKETLQNAHNQVYHLIEAKQYEEAIDLLQITLARVEKMLGESSEESFGFRSKLVSAYRLAGREEEAITQAEEAVASRKEHFGPHDPGLVDALRDLARCLFHTNDGDRAVEKGRELVKVSTAIHGSESLITLRALTDLAWALRWNAEFEEAIRLTEEALKSAEQNYGVGHFQTIEFLQSLGYAYVNAGREPEAASLLQRALELTEDTFGPESSETVSAMRDLAENQEGMDRYKEALSLRKSISEIQRRKFGPVHENSVLALAYLARTVGKTGDFDKANKGFDEAETAGRIVYRGEPEVLNWFLLERGILFKDQGMLGNANSHIEDYLSRGGEGEKKVYRRFRARLELAEMSILQRKFVDAESLLDDIEQSLLRAELSGLERKWVRDGLAKHRASISESTLRNETEAPRN